MTRGGNRGKPAVDAKIDARLAANRKPTMADMRNAKAAWDAARSQNEAMGIEVCMVVVGYVTGRDPFRLLARVAADTGDDTMPDPPLTDAEMQPVAFAAKMAFAKVLAARKRR
ncbi:MAG: hypothetical protein KA310_03315 [Pseudomonadales bacterium]|nr:hypothetical protein [Pseudomonadales bacterium]